MSDNLVKIRFELEPDDDGYPPADHEYVWAKSIGSGLYQIDNIPFFAKNVSWRDIVSASPVGKGDLAFEEVKQENGHSTLRVILFDVSETNAAREELRQLGCSTELSHIEGLFAVDVPPEIDLNTILEYLKARESDGRLEYEEACLAHTP